MPEIDERRKKEEEVNEKNETEGEVGHRLMTRTHAVAVSGRGNPGCGGGSTMPDINERRKKEEEVNMKNKKKKTGRWTAAHDTILTCGAPFGTTKGGVEGLPFSMPPQALCGAVQSSQGASVPCSFHQFTS
jgi:hypothetical protein